VTSVGVTVLTAVGAVAGCGGEVQSSQCFIKDYLCVVVPVPSCPSVCACACALFAPSENTTITNETSRTRRSRVPIWRLARVL